MARYLLRRLGWALVMLFGISLITFVVAYRLPGDPAALLAGPQATPEVIAGIRRNLHLDDPLPVQYGRFVGRLLQGDLGTSYVSGQPVAQEIGARLPATLTLAFAGWSCWLLLGTLFGLFAAARPTPAREGTLLAFSVLGASVPTFWVGILLLYVFAVRLPWFPTGGYGEPSSLVLPMLTLAASGVAYYSRLVHANLSEVLSQDYVRTARAKGLSPRAVLLRHALRNALLPLVTLAGADLAALLGGVVFTEAVFAWPGMGLLALSAVQDRNVPVILGVVLVSATFVVLGNLIVDLLYPLLDPRIRHSGD